mmetsp:Transcript_15953/g.33705  ORF Transcript_15953/g.33705 Transcript_15953/m.33705 type:complete len:173 (+) Transcript_15953:755-1273(+)
MDLRQHWMDITNYYKEFVDMKSLCQWNDRRTQGHVYNHSGIIDIVCREKGLDQKAITKDQEVEFMTSQQERMLGVHFIMNLDWERYGDVIKKFDQDYFSGSNKYPTKLHDAYILQKNWTRRSSKKHVPGKLGLSFNTLGEGDEDGEALVNDGKIPACPRCECTTTAKDRDVL